MRKNAISGCAYWRRPVWRQAGKIWPSVTWRSLLPGTRRPRGYGTGETCTLPTGWQKAVDCYRQSWEKDRSNPVPLYLRGWALSQSGQDAEGKKVMELARLLPLGDGHRRFALAEAMIEHDLFAAAAGECELASELVDSTRESTSLTEPIHVAMDQKDFRKAARLGQRAVLALVAEDTRLSEELVDRVHVVNQVHLCRARACWMPARFDQALQEAETCLLLEPGDGDVVAYLLPGLEKAGRMKEADALYARVLSVHEKLLADYPRGPAAHNALAWTMARCRRTLDKALEHAQKTVELEPDNPGGLDTLAEVHFQRGNKDKAVELVKKCMELEPQESYFHKQLRRFEAGDPSTDPPAK